MTLDDGCFGALGDLAVLPMYSHAVPASHGALGMQVVQRAMTSAMLGCSSTHLK